MGVRITTIGHLDVRPALNDEEFSYLTGFAESRRWSRPQGPLWVSHSPFGLDDEEPHDTDAYNTPPDGQPGLWCPWRPSCEGRCLTVADVDERPRQVVPWLQYLIDVFLRPEARALGLPDFAEFTFDHLVSGVVATHHLGSGELSVIRVVDGSVQREALRPGEAAWWAA